MPHTHPNRPTQVIAAQRTRRGEVQYLVKWKGFELYSREDSWLSKEDLAGAPDVLSAWTNAHPELA